MRIAINGFGRIGRLVLRAALKNKKIKCIAVNDLSEPKVRAHLFKYDSTHGTYKGSVSHTKSSIKIDGKKVLVFGERDPENLPWKENKIDTVVECTGHFLTKELAGKHLLAGAKRVILSAPAKDDSIKTICYGVNHKQIRKSDTIISNASCTTNCMAPIVQVLDKKFGISKGYMLTVHALTNSQRILDASHKDLRRARAAPFNIIPTSTGATKAVERVIPKMKGKLNGSAIRVPIQNGSIIDFAVQLKKKATIEQINKEFEKASKGKLKGIMEYSTLPLVSSDIIGNSHSAIIDSDLTDANGNLVKIVAWYDNEWGYSNRMIDLILSLK